MEQADVSGESLVLLLASQGHPAFAQQLQNAIRQDVLVGPHRYHSVALAGRRKADIQSGPLCPDPLDSDAPRIL
eukprot:15436737-Alexandrium_andersonii.AAC.1